MKLHIQSNHEVEAIECDEDDKEQNAKANREMEDGKISIESYLETKRSIIC